MKKEIWENHRRQAERTLSSTRDDRKAGNHDRASHDEHSENNIACAEKIRDIIYNLVKRAG